jgi:MFS family permease
VRFFCCIKDEINTFTKKSGVSSKPNPYAVFNVPEFGYFISARFFLTIAIQMQSVIVGWQVYSITKNVFALGMIGLTEAIPFIITSFFSGHVADSFDRRKIIRWATLFFMLGTLLLFSFTLESSTVIQNFGATPIFGIIVLVGVARGFLSPAVPSLLTQIVPRELYPNSAAWNTTIWHIGAIAGPAIAGILYGFFGPTMAYGINMLFLCIALFFFSLISFRPLPAKQIGETLKQSLTVGIKFVFSNQIILGALSLDLFAVLFGGAVAMLPAIADRILHVGPEALGMLRAAPAVGAVIMAFVMAYHPPLKNSGIKLLWGVGAFGICTILFALSSNFYLSFFLLLLTGAFDNVSVIIRHTILQLMTPDQMRGRVSSVNSIFIGSSNEIGAFESGLAAQLLGLVPSIVFGGIMTLLIVAVVAKVAPSLKNLSLEKVK